MQTAKIIKLEFCSTGPGGGKDPSCSHGSGSGSGDGGEARSDSAGATAAAHAASREARGSRDPALHEKAVRAHDHAAAVHERGGRKHVAESHRFNAGKHRAILDKLHGAVHIGKVLGKAVVRGAKSARSPSMPHGGGGGGSAGGAGRRVKKKKLIKLSYCETGPGGGKDPTCSPKSAAARDASEKATAEKNPMRAAKLHVAARDAHYKAARDIDKNRGYGQPASKEHVKQGYVHEQAAREITAKLLGTDREKFLSKEAAKLAKQAKVEEAKSATRVHGQMLKATLHGVLATAASRVKSYEGLERAALHAAKLLRTVGHVKNAEYHERAAVGRVKNRKRYESML